MPLVFTNLAVKAGIHLLKYNIWVIAISRSEAEPDEILQKPTPITQQGGVKLISRRRIIN